MEKSKRLPKSFRSENEASRFVGTHDLADYDAEFADANVRFDVQRETYLFPVRRRLAERIVAVARRRKIPSEKLVERLLSRGVNEESRRAGGS